MIFLFIINFQVSFLINHTFLFIDITVIWSSFNIWWFCCIYYILNFLYIIINYLSFRFTNIIKNILYNNFLRLLIYNNLFHNFSLFFFNFSLCFISHCTWIFTLCIINLGNLLSFQSYFYFLFLLTSIRTSRFIREITKIRIILNNWRGQWSCYNLFHLRNIWHWRQCNWLRVWLFGNRFQFRNSY